MPYKNQHAARLADPKLFTRFARVNDRGGKGVDFIFGYKGSSSFLQAIRFRSDIWTVGKAKKWLRDHYYKWIKFESARSSMHKNPIKSRVEFNNRLDAFIEEEKKGISDYKAFLLALPVNAEANAVRRVIAKIIRDEEEHLKLLMRIRWF